MTIISLFLMFDKPDDADDYLENASVNDKAIIVEVKEKNLYFTIFMVTKSVLSIFA